MNLVSVSVVFTFLNNVKLFIAVILFLSLHTLFLRLAWFRPVRLPACINCQCFAWSSRCSVVSQRSVRVLQSPSGNRR